MDDAFRNFMISIHAPLAGCDLEAGIVTGDGNKFQSTHPLRGATSDPVPGRQEQVISIHAPLAGCDQKPATLLPENIKFQSTHPLRGATAKIHKFLCVLL